MNKKSQGESGGFNWVVLLVIFSILLVVLMIMFGQDATVAGYKLDDILTFLKK